MSLRKRLRVLWAALTQDWRQEVCQDCKASWWADRRSVASEGLCDECEGRACAAWYEAREQMKAQMTKEVA